jgi:hypothetical protein
MEVEATPQEIKISKKRNPPVYEKFIVVPYNEDNLEMLQELEFEQGEGKDTKSLKIPFEVREARVKKTEREKKAHNARYRAEYKNRPIVREKARLHAQNPLVKEKNREYSRLPETRERKKVLSKRNRAIRKMLKEKKPQLYESFMEEVVSGMHPLSDEHFQQVMNEVK